MTSSSPRNRASPSAGGLGRRLGALSDPAGAGLVRPPAARGVGAQPHRPHGVDPGHDLHPRAGRRRIGPGDHHAGRTGRHGQVRQPLPRPVARGSGRGDARRRPARPSSSLRRPARSRRGSGPGCRPPALRAAGRRGCARCRRPPRHRASATDQVSLSTRPACSPPCSTSRSPSTTTQGATRSDGRRGEAASSRSMVGVPSSPPIRQSPRPGVAAASSRTGATRRAVSPRRPGRAPDRPPAGRRREGRRPGRPRQVQVGRRPARGVVTRDPPGDGAPGRAVRSSTHQGRPGGQRLDQREVGQHGSEPRLRWSRVLHVPSALRRRPRSVPVTRATRKCDARRRPRATRAAGRTSTESRSRWRARVDSSSGLRSPAGGTSGSTTVGTSSGRLAGHTPAGPTPRRRSGVTSRRSAAPAPAPLARTPAVRLRPADVGRAHQPYTVDEDAQRVGGLQAARRRGQGRSG